MFLEIQEECRTGNNPRLLHSVALPRPHQIPQLSKDTEIQRDKSVRYVFEGEHRLERASLTLQIGSPTPHHDNEKN